VAQRGAVRLEGGVGMEAPSTLINRFLRDV
jgi:hypothetical protein